jgi:hypothetical protein
MKYEHLRGRPIPKESNFFAWGDFMRRLLLAIFSICTLASVTVAQTAVVSQLDPEQNWDNLQMLQVGEKIQVVDQELKKLDGEFSAVSEEAVSFVVRTARRFLIFGARGMKQVTLRREDVLRISSWDQSNRKRNTLIGAAIGGAGAAAIIATAATQPDELGRGIGFLIAAYTAWIPIFGGAHIGRAVSSPHTIYRVPPRQGQTTP